MNILFIALLIALTSTLNIVCFFVGAKVGQKIVRGETIETPTLNPIKAIREREDRKNAEIEQNRIDKIMRNIESYNGTSTGQEDV